MKRKVGIFLLWVIFFISLISLYVLSHELLIDYVSWLLMLLIGGLGIFIGATTLAISFSFDSNVISLTENIETNLKRKRIAQNVIIVCIILSAVIMCFIFFNLNSNFIIAYLCGFFLAGSLGLTIKQFSDTPNQSDK